MEITQSKQQEELLNTTGKSNSSTELEIKALENTPFSMVREKNEWFGVIADHRITESYRSEKELEKELKKITWDRIIQVIWAVASKYNKLTKRLENE